METTKSKIDLKEVLNTGKFNFEEAANHKKWLETDRYDIQPETEEYGVSSFIYNSHRPFNPERLKKSLDDSFILNITNHDHAHGPPVEAGGDELVQANDQAQGEDTNDTGAEEEDDDYEPETDE